MHERLLAALESVAQVRLVAALRDDRLGFPDRKDLRVFIGDVHLISDRRRVEGEFTYSTNYPGLLTMTGVLDAAHAYPTGHITIDGYTDSVPDLRLPGGNVALSQDRANNLKIWLRKHGVAAYRITTRGFGDADPVAPNTPNGQPANRRVVIAFRLTSSTTMTGPRRAVP